MPDKTPKALKSAPSKVVAFATGRLGRHLSCNDLDVHTALRCLATPALGEQRFLL